MNHLLQITDEQAELIVEALDLMMRVNMGQLDTVYQKLMLGRQHPGVMPWSEAIDRKSRQLLHELKQMWFALDLGGPHGKNAYYGILSDKMPPAMRIAYQLYTVISHRNATTAEQSLFEETPPHAVIRLVGEINPGPMPWRRNVASNESVPTTEPKRRKARKKKSAK